MNSRYHARRAAMLVIASALALLSHSARGAGTRIFWGASGGFFYCGSYSPLQAALDQTTQIVAQLIFSPDSTRDQPQVPDGLGLSGDDVLLDQVVVTVSSRAGSAWGDFIGTDYEATTTLTGFVYGRVVMTPMWQWYGVYDGPVFDLSNAPSSTPFTYNFNTDLSNGDEMGWSYCLSCMQPCPEPVYAIDQSNESVAVSYQAADSNGRYQLQVTHDLTSGVWTNVGTNVAAGLAVATNQGDGASFRLIKTRAFP